MSQLFLSVLKVQCAIIFFLTNENDREDSVFARILNPPRPEYKNPMLDKAGFPNEKLQKDLNNNSPIMGCSLHSKSKAINCSKDSRALVLAKCSFIIY